MTSVAAASPLRFIALSDPDLERLADFAARLTRSQALWVSGYFAAVARAGEPVTADPDTQADTVTILYGSETGNAAAFARQCATKAAALGLKADLQDMASYKPQRLKDEKFLLLITSTHGDGEPPEPARGFFEFVHSRKAPKLASLRYAVLGLGDSTYEHFCEAARSLDRQFSMLGATRLHSRVDCDVDYDESATAWRDAVFDKIRTEFEARNEKPRQSAIAVSSSPPSIAAKYSKSSPFLAPVIENIRITGRGSTKVIRHIELGLAGSGLTYTPGDALGVIPTNDPELVRNLLRALGFSGAESVRVNGEMVPLETALREKFEITTVTPRFLKAWAAASGSTELAQLADPEEPSSVSRFLKAYHVIDIAKAHPVAGLEPDAFTAMLRRLQPRLYSIASSQAAAPEEVHIAVATVRYHLHGSERLGVASGWLAERVQVDDRLPVYIQPNHNFRLPDDPATPIIMIGAGTGVAPYRAFMQHRAEHGAAGPAWLFFGERRFRTDFLYQVEWQAWLKSGVLRRIDLAFSRDQDSKIYVQHRMREQAREFYAWLENGAHVYVCGDASAMAPDVNAALVSIVQQQASCSDEQAANYVRTLQAAGRYHRDVY